MTNLGDMLREAREARGLTWEEVERATHIRLKYLEALEDNRFQELPGDVYTRGFLRNYSIFLELPYTDVIAAYETTLNPTAKRALRPAVATAAGAAGTPRADVAPRSIESGARPMRPSRPEAGIRIQPVSPEPVNTRLRYAPSCTVVSGLALVVLIASYLLYSTFTSSQKALPTPHPATGHADDAGGLAAHGDDLADARLDAAAHARPQPDPDATPGADRAAGQHPARRLPGSGHAPGRRRSRHAGRYPGGDGDGGQQHDHGRDLDPAGGVVPGVCG
jgi:transcriptional regulator with XRE-family HTH domain